MAKFTLAIWSIFVWTEKFNDGFCTHFLLLCGLKSSHNNSRLINHWCEWTLRVWIVQWFRSRWSQINDCDAGTHSVGRYATTVGSSAFGVILTRDVPQFRQIMAYSSPFSGSVQPQMSFAIKLKHNETVVGETNHEKKTFWKNWRFVKNLSCALHTVHCTGACVPPAYKGT